MARKIDININKLAESYEKYKTLTKVAKLFNISGKTVKRRLNILGIPTRPSGMPPKYTCNHDFFSRNTLESFYWAGFIAADGNLEFKTENNKYISIEINRKDREHLEKFKRCINYTGKVRNTEHLDKRTKKIRYGSVIKIASVRIFDDLAKFGVVPCKSKIYKFPKWLAKHPLINHFIRGYIDGDGSWYLKGKTRELRCQIIGTKQCMEYFRDILYKSCGTSNILKINKCYGSKMTFCLHYSGNKQCKKIRDFVYKDATNNIYLVRKKDIVFNDWVEKPPKRAGGIRPVIGVEIKTNKILFLGAIVDGKKYSMDSSCITKCCKNKQKTHKGYTWRYATKKEIKEHMKEQ